MLCKSLVHKRITNAFKVETACDSVIPRPFGRIFFESISSFFHCVVQFIVTKFYVNMLLYILLKISYFI